MSNELKESELNLDLAFLPAWAQESPEINRYANYEGEREDRRGPRGKGPRRDRDFGGPRPPRDRPRDDRPRDDRPRGAHPGRDRQREDRGPRGRGGRSGPGDPRGGRPPFEKRPELPPIGVEINLVPDPHGVDSLTRQIRVTGRAYPLFDIARLVLQKDDRFNIEFRVRKAPEGAPPQPLLACVLDDTVWLNEEDAVNHVLEKHLATFYQIEKTPTDPPKGTYTFVAQCGMSGAVLGPPNYHDYQNKLHKLHQERFANMPFDRFKSRVKIVRDEEVVKKWIEEQSFKTEYVVLNVPEPVKLASWDEVREHFRAVHLPNIVKQVEQQTVAAPKVRRAGSRDLQRHVVQEIEQQRRFPLKVVTALSQQFAARGLQFFKVNKNIVHVAVARPHFLDIEAEPVSDGVKRIVQFVNDHPRCTVKDLVHALAPAPAVTAVTATATEAPTATSEAGQPAAAPKPSHEPTEAQKAVLSELHWLVHSGHVIEFASGELETARKPLPKPPPAPRKTPAKKPATTIPGEAAATAETTAAPAAAGPAVGGDAPTEASAFNADVANESAMEPEPVTGSLSEVPPDPIESQAGAGPEAGEVAGGPATEPRDPSPAG